MKHLEAVIAELQAERAPLAARLDAIDAALENLRYLYREQPAEPKREAKPRRGRAAKRATREKTSPTIDRMVNRVLGEPRRIETGTAAGRHQKLLDIISKSEAGMTIAELRTRTPQMKSSDRQNSLTVLKQKKQIYRSGNAWVASALATRLEPTNGAAH